MAGFVRRFTVFPQISTITEIEGINVVDLLPPGIFVGLTTGTVCLIGEWPKGTQNQSVVVQGDRTIEDGFGGFSLSLTDPLSFATNPFSNGNAFVWLKQKTFRKLVLVRVDMDLSEGVHVQLTGTPTPLAQDVTIPAGTRVRDAGVPTIEFALSDDITFAAGTDLAAVAFTAYAAATPTYSTRTVADVPVYSTQGNPEAGVGDVDSVDATDLFNAGIGTGTALPTLVVIASTALTDTAPANAAVLTPLTSGQIDTAYENTIDASQPGEEATDDVVIVASARQSAAIRTRLLENARDSSAVGRGRISLNRSPIGTLPGTGAGEVQNAADPGVGANRSDRIIHCYPHFEQRISEIASLDPTATISVPEVLVGADSAMSVLLSNLPPENNPGQSTQNIASGGLLTFIRKLEDGLTGAGLPTKFLLSDYVAFKASGIAALRRSPEISEWVVQSGVTSVSPTLFPTQAPIKRRRMADFIQDSLATISLKFNKLPGTTDRFDSLLGELTDFLEILLSSTNPAQQRIAEYSIDGESGNTEDLQALGIRVIIINVRLLDTLDFIVLQTTIGETVTIEAQA